MIVQPSQLSRACSAWPIRGSAVATIVESTDAMKSAIAQMKKISRRRGSDSGRDDASPSGAGGVRLGFAGCTRCEMSAGMPSTCSSGSPASQVESSVGSSMGTTCSVASFAARRSRVPVRTRIGRRARLKAGACGHRSSTYRRGAVARKFGDVSVGEPKLRPASLAPPVPSWSPTPTRQRADNQREGRS